MSKFTIPAAIITPAITIILAAGALGYGGYVVLPKMVRAYTDELLKKGEKDTMSKLLLIVNEKFPLASTKKKLEIAEALNHGCIIHDIPHHIILGIIDVETGGTWKVDAESPVGARGIMQIMPAMGRVYMRTERMDYSDERLNDPVLNITIGINMLADAHANHVSAKRVDSSDYTAALHSYNAGPRPTAELYASKTLNPAALWYPAKVMSAAKKYQDLGL